MRLLHLAPRLSQRGGADQYLLAAIEALAGRCQQRLVVGRLDADLQPPCPTTRVAGLDASGLESDPPDLAALQRQIDEFRPDVVHLHAVVQPEILAAAAGWPSVLTVHDHRLFCPGRGKWTAAQRVCREPMAHSRCAACFAERGYFERIFALTRQRLAAAARLRICVLSEYMRAELQAVGLAPDRIRIVGPAVRGLLVEPNQTRPACVLFVGRLVEAKGVWDAVAAWRLSDLDLPLVLAGTGPLRAAAEAEGLRVTGWLDRAELTAIYRRSAVVLMPSRWQEPFGIVGLEALSLGVPVAAFESGGVAEWHPGPGLVAWGDVDGLAAATSALAGTRAVEPGAFSHDRFTAGLEVLFESVAGG